MSAATSGRSTTPITSPAASGVAPRTPRSFQASIGAEHQFGKDWTLSGDFVHWRVYNDWIRTDSNLVYNPATGYNINPTVVPRPNGALTTILNFTTPNAAGSLYDGLQMELRKRFSHGLTMGASYTLARLKDSTTGPFISPTTSTTWPMSGPTQWTTSATRSRSTPATR